MATRGTDHACRADDPCPAGSPAGHMTWDHPDSERARGIMHACARRLPSLAAASIGMCSGGDRGKGRVSGRPTHLHHKASRRRRLTT